MKAVLRDYSGGEIHVADVPPPSLQSNGVIVLNGASLVSAGSEKAAVEFTKMNLLQKAQARPDYVQKVLNRVNQEGLISTVQAVNNMIGTPMPLGYSCAGTVQMVGSQVSDLKPGDRVACAGLGYANHAETLYIPRNLAVPIPDGVTFEEASYVTLGAIAMQGVRQADVAVGENVVVIGLGLVGQLTAQICTAAGCRVFGTDLDPNKVKLALELGAHAGLSPQEGDVAAAVQQFTRNRGADKVIITAATASSQPVEMAAELARDRACIVAVGDVGLNVPRRTYYEKELDLRLSRSYGPGRYDPTYEEKGVDYPIGYVRWTENRNMESFLDLVAEGKVRLGPLTTHRFPIEQADQAYALLTGERQEPFIGIMLTYEVDQPQPSRVWLDHPNGATRPAGPGKKETLSFGILGAGRFAQGVLLPRLSKIAGVQIAGLATGSGLTARAVADKYHCQFCTSDYREVLNEPTIDAVLIATRHNLHAKMAIEALTMGKHVFVEKPLAINEEELQAVAIAYQAAQQRVHQRTPILMVGFNRRFSPLAVPLRDTFGGQPAVINYRVNAGFIPADSWVHDPEVGGGRIVGEVCHFVDFLQFVTGTDPVKVFAWALGDHQELPHDPDTLCIQITMTDGSLGTITYAANGDSSFPKERVEVFGGGSVGVIDNWRRAEIVSHGKHSTKRSLLSSAKGHAEELEAFVSAIRSGEMPVPFSTLLASARATFAIQKSLRTGQPVVVGSAVGTEVYA